MYSMTGFGAIKKRIEDVDIVIEIKTLNSKYLETKLYLPSHLKSYEVEIINIIKDHFSRGSIELYIDYRKPVQEILIDKENLKKAYIELKNFTKNELKTNDTIDLKTLISTNKFWLTPKSNIETKEWKLIKKYIKEACEKVLESRKKEGKAIQKDMEKLLNSIKKTVEKIQKLYEKLSKKNIQNHIKKLKENLERVGGEIDEKKLYEEAAIYVSKNDINEEIVRLKEHINRAVEIIKKSDKPVGKKLDFLFQEMLREANTINSKTQELDIIYKTIDIKDNIEKLREHSRNIE